MLKNNRQPSSHSARDKGTPGSTLFARRVRAVVAKIPRGSKLTYGEVARRAGYPGAARAVGTIMSHNFDSSIPCHRVVRADGKIGGYNRGGMLRKCELLTEEGAL